ncbi:MAG: hypothetical protein ACJ77K_15755 [Bacteroidia bacterium]
MLKFRFITFLDHPNNLSGKVEIIEVDYIQWACDCANWIQVKDEKNCSNGIDENKCFFIEAENSSLKEVENSFVFAVHSNKLRLTGQFYTDKGIASDYDSENEKPDPARVFRYSKIEIIK